ncbi:hypothetical protein KQH40_00585 [bacterium]|nr:hypothetical protein [bacterium]
MEPIKAWEAVKQQLQTDMAKATFDTWVAPTCYLDYNAGTMTIGVPNGYARDWLTSRLSALIQNILRGMLDAEVEIQFVIDPKAEIEKQDNALDSIEEKITLNPDEIRISIQRDILEAITRPDSALYFPGYWLRWIPYIGASPFLTILAFRQALYLAENCFEEGREFSVSETKVASIIGAFRQRIRSQNEKGKLSWFLSTNKSTTVQKVGNRLKREAHSYIFKPSPITPGDLEEIMEWLLDNNLDKDPVAALTKAVAAQPKEIISFPPKKPTKLQKKAKASNAGDLTAKILSYCPEEMDKTTRARVLDLASKLRGRMINSDGQVKVPLFFLKHVAAELTPTSALTIIFLRKKAYRNSATGEIRERVTLKKDELANVLGIASNSIYRYLPIQVSEDDQRRSDDMIEKRKPLENYIRDITQHSNGTMSLTVSTTDYLPTEIEAEYQEALKLASALIEDCSPQEAEEILDIILAMQDDESIQDSQDHTIDDSQDHTIEESQNHTISNSQDHTMEESQNHTIGDSQNHTFARFTKTYQLKYFVFKYIKAEILKDTILNLITDLNTLNTDSQTEETQTLAWPAQSGKWDFSTLFKSCRIDRETQKKILANQATPEALVSHLIYAFSPEGEGLIQPVRYAVSKVLRPGDGDLGSGPRHDRLVSLGPSGLQALIKSTEVNDYRELSVDQTLIGASDWIKIMKGHKNIGSIIDLGELLGVLKISYSGRAK